MIRLNWITLPFCVFVLSLFSREDVISPEGAQGNSESIELCRNDQTGRLQVLLDGSEILVYQYAESLDLPHYWPLNSPSGKNMLVQQAEPYPHHRSFWFADTICFEGGREVSTYYAWNSGMQLGENRYGPPFRDHVRHGEFIRLETDSDRAVIESMLVWEMDGRTPILEEKRRLLVHALGDGEYLLDIAFILTAAYGKVEFVSDDVHYAWPYLRMHPRFNGENGGAITTDSGATGQAATNMKTALWIDYSNTIEGFTEGVAVFQRPDGRKHRWLTREYGCFGPRRPDEQSGKPFTLKKGDAISQRIGVFVHKGDVESGRVAQMYQKYIQDHLR